MELNTLEAYWFISGRNNFVHGHLPLLSLLRKRNSFEEFQSYLPPRDSLAKVHYTKVNFC